MSYHRGGAGSSFLRILITIMSLAVVSLGAAFFWQRAEDSADGGDTSSPVSETQTSKDSSAAASEDEYHNIDTSGDASSEAPDSLSSEADNSSSGGEASTDEMSAGQQEAIGAPSAYAREAIAGSVPLSKPVGYSYFEDAIFFGDSISTGIPLYMQTMVKGAAVIASQGVSPGGALTSQCINTDSGRVTMLEAAKGKGERQKVYIMLGANALDYDEATFIKGYTEFLQAVKAEYPDAVIYVQSMLPVTANVNNVYPSENINNERISGYNASICKMAIEQGVNYVDVAQGIVDENGMLPNEASPLDGMHLTSEYYMKWFDYLRNHTVNPKK